MHVRFRVPGIEMLSGILWMNMLWTLTNADSGPCDVRLKALDFFGVLEWNCSGLLPNATFSVRIRTQGEDWRDVKQCVGVSSGSCNLSQDITGFRDYAQLGVEEQLGNLRWMEKRTKKTDLREITEFSAPLLAMRVVKTNGGSGRSQIGVKVNFPCAPKALKDCADWMKEQPLSCCPVTLPLPYWDDTNVTVTLFNKQQPEHRQTRSELLTDVSIDEFIFGSLHAGQEYCAVASFTRSAISQPVCLQLDPLPVVLWPIVLGAGLSSLSFIPLMALYLWRRKTPQDHLPRALEGLLDPVPGCPVLGESPIRLPADDDTPSIISLCSCDHHSQPVTQLPPPISHLHQSESQFQSQSQDQDLYQYHQYYSNPLTELPVKDTTGSDSGGLVQEGHPEVTLAPLLGQGSGGIAVQTYGAPQLWDGFTYLADNPGIPLSSLKLGLGELDEGLYLDEELMEQSGRMVCPWMEDDGMDHYETEGGGGGHIAR